LWRELWQKAKNLKPQEGERQAKLKAGKELAQGNPQAVGNHFDVEQTGIAMAAFDICKVATIQSQGFGHLILCPTLSLPQRTDALSKVGKEGITGHSPIMVCRLSATKRLSATIFKRVDCVIFVQSRDAPLLGGYSYAIKSHRIQVKALLCFGLDCEEGLQREALVQAVAIALNEVVAEDRGIGVPELEGGRVFPAWNAVDRAAEST
jgi:hypothetical protein